MGSVSNSHPTLPQVVCGNSNKPIDAPRPLKVIYIGAGISGIVAAIEFLRAVPSLELVIYEKNPEIGGTWYENRYPGCACDIPAHAYQLSFESWTEWSQFYAGAPEILEYWKRVANKYGVHKHIHFNHKCTKAIWDETRTKWTVEMLKTDLEVPIYVKDEADVLLTGTGLLNEWKWPDIPGLHNFKGELLHSANWNENFDPINKSVAVIGAGSSGIQIVPALAAKVSHMDHYVRGKTWISNQLSEDLLKDRALEGGTNFEYSRREKETWKQDPATYLAYRRALEFRLQGTYEISQRDSPRHTSARTAYEKTMRERLQSKPAIIEHLIPDFPPLCKRLTPGPGYLEALTAPHVNLVADPIAYVESDAIVSKDETRRPVDAIICATGFETSPAAGFPIYGQNGVNLREKYHNRPSTYLGMSTDQFPNFFQSLGPNSFQGSGSLLIMIEYAHRYMAQILHKLVYGNVRTIQPKLRQVENFTNHCDEHFKKTVFTDNCVSWYKTAVPGATPEERKSARVTALWPGSSLHALRALQSVRWEDYEMDFYEDDDFAWFGNGWTVAEQDIGDDLNSLTWYLEQSQYLHEPLRVPDHPRSASYVSESVQKISNVSRRVSLQH